MLIEAQAKSVRIRIGSRKVSKGLSPRACMFLLGGRRSRCLGSFRYLGWGLHTGFSQRPVDGSPNLRLRQRPSDALAVDEQGRRTVHPQAVALLHRSAHSCLILFGDAHVEFRPIQLGPLALLTR